MDLLAKWELCGKPIYTTLQAIVAIETLTKRQGLSVEIEWVGVGVAHFELWQRAKNS